MYICQGKIYVQAGVATTVTVTVTVATGEKEYGGASVGSGPYEGGMLLVLLESELSFYDELYLAIAAQKLLRLSESKATDWPSTVSMLMLALVLMP